MAPRAAIDLAGRLRDAGVGVVLGVPPESAFVALEGIPVGTALSLVTSSLLFCNDDLQGVGVPFLIPWANVALLAAASGAASLATAWPARRRPGQAGGALGIAD